MNRFLSLILIAVLALGALTAPRAQAAPDELTVWAGGGTDVGTTLCYAVTSTYSRSGGSPVITFLSATSDKGASVVQFYTAASPVQCNYTNSTVTIPVTSTNGFNFSSGIIVIRHWLTDTYERRILTTSTGSTNLTVTSAPTAAVLPGDQIWPMATAGAIPCGNTTLTLNGTGIYSGQRGKPLLFEVDCGTNGQINAAWAAYVP